MAARNYVPRIPAIWDWLRGRGPGTFTVEELLEGRDWPRSAVVKSLTIMVRDGDLLKEGPGVYTLVKMPEPTKAVRAKKRPKPPGVDGGPPKPPTPPAEPYAVVDAVLANLFPAGLQVAHLRQVIEWREATKALLELMEKE